MKKVSVLKPVSRESILEKIKSPILEKNISGVGLVRYHRLGFEDYYKLQAFASDSAEFAARAIVLGFDEPKFTEEDIPALKSGLFGSVSKMGALPLEGAADVAIKDDDLIK